jgi:hypothetical protein
MIASLHAASVCLTMLVAVQAMRRFDLRAEFGAAGEYLTTVACYALTFALLAGLAIETGRLLANA